MARPQPIIVQRPIIKDTTWSDLSQGVANWLPFIQLMAQQKAKEDQKAQADQLLQNMYTQSAPQGMTAVSNGPVMGSAVEVPNNTFTPILTPLQKLQQQMRDIRDTQSGELSFYPDLITGGTVTPQAPLTQGGFALNQLAGKEQLSPQYNMAKAAMMTNPEEFGKQLTAFMFPKPDVSTNLDEVLAQKVNKGEITLAQAYALKQNMKDLTPEQQAFKNLSSEDQRKILLKGTEDKVTVTNLPPIMDAFLARKFGSQYVVGTPQSRAPFIDYLNSSEGKKEFDSQVPELVKLMANPFYQIIPTSEGFMQFNARNPQAPPVNTGQQKPLTPEMITAEQQFGSLQDSLNKVKETYDKNFVGPIEGRLGKIEEKTVGLPEQQATFYSATAAINNALIYALSGKQINESEYNRLKEQLPQINLPPSVFEVRMKEFERILNSIITERHKASGGYGVPKIGNGKQLSPGKSNPSTNKPIPLDEYLKQQGH